MYFKNAFKYIKKASYNFFIRKRTSLINQSYYCGHLSAIDSSFMAQFEPSPPPMIYTKYRNFGNKYGVSHHYSFPSNETKDIKLETTNKV